MLSRARRVVVVAGAVAFFAPFTAAAETWKNVSIIDTLCLKDYKDNADSHTKECALQCVKGGYGVLTADGKFLKFDAAGNEKTVAALNATEKEEKLRATVVGVRGADGSIKVESIVIE
jgi:VCBS repeat-containing protein